MKVSIRLAYGFAAWLALSSTALAQQGPRSAIADNPMDIHTWFIIAAVGAFLAWSISYSLQLHKEQLERQKNRDDLRRLKDELLDSIASLEDQRAAGTVTDAVYRSEIRELRHRLAHVLSQLGAQDPPRGRSASKG